MSQTLAVSPNNPAGIAYPADTAQFESERELGDGSVLIQTGTHLPRSLVLTRTALLSGWSLAGNSRSAFEREMREAGWTLFFMAGIIQITAFGLNERNTLSAALNRLAGRVKSQSCNSFEIAHITRESFLGVCRVSISAHARHLQKEALFLGQSNPARNK